MVVLLWYDKFLCLSPLFEDVPTVEDAQIRLKVVQNEWDVDRLQNLLGSQKALAVVETVGALRNDKDVLLWLPGIFSSKST